MGLDVYSGTGPIDWTQVKSDGEGFVYLKASEGLHEIDPAVKGNAAGAKQAGMLVGFYHFFHVGLDAKQQADHFLNAAKGAGYDHLTDLPLCMDLEDRAGAAACGHTTLVQRVSTFLSEVQAAIGRAPLIYVDADFAGNILRGGFSGHPLWLACYSAALPKPLPGGWTDWRFWQYGDTATIRGIRGNVVDTDRWNGSYAELAAWAGVQKPVSKAGC